MRVRIPPRTQIKPIAQRTMNTKFFNRVIGHANILVGNDIDQLVNEAMNRVARLRDYYQTNIRQSLQDLGAACVSNHSTGDRKSLFIVLDKEYQVSDEDWQNMTIRDIERKYNIRIL